MSLFAFIVAFFLFVPFIIFIYFYFFIKNLYLVNGGNCWCLEVHADVVLLRFAKLFALSLLCRTILI